MKSVSFVVVRWLVLLCVVISQYMRLSDAWRVAQSSFALIKCVCIIFRDSSEFVICVLCHSLRFPPFANQSRFPFYTWLSRHMHFNFENCNHIKRSKNTSTELIIRSTANPNFLHSALNTIIFWISSGLHMFLQTRCNQFFWAQHWIALEILKVKPHGNLLVFGHLNCLDP